MADPNKPVSVITSYFAALGAGTNKGAAEMVSGVVKGVDWVDKKAGHETHYGQHVEQAIVDTLEAQDRKSFSSVPAFNAAAATGGQRFVYRAGKLVPAAALTVMSLGTAAGGVVAVESTTLAEGVATYVAENPNQAIRTTVGAVRLGAKGVHLAGDTVRATTTASRLALE